MKHGKLKFCRAKDSHKTGVTVEPDRHSTSIVYQHRRMQKGGLHHKYDSTAETIILAGNWEVKLFKRHGLAPPQ